LRKEGFEITLNPYGRKLKKGEILKLCRNAAGILAGTETLDRDVLQRLPNLKVISRCGTGLESVDLQATKALKIVVYNTPDAPTLAVSELTIALILNLLRRINYMDSAIRHGNWKKIMGNLLFAKQVGIIGFGRIGRKVSELLKPFGCQISYYDPFVKDGVLGLKKLALKTLLGRSDVISVHASVKNVIIGKKEFSSIKKGAYLVNTSRGEAIDEKTLYAALKNGTLAGAALDVFTKEPYNGPLTELENVILTSHIGSYAKEARIEMEMEAVENLLKGFKRVSKRR